MAGFIRLAHGVEAGEPVETPTVVRDRYVERDRSATPDLDATAEYVNNHLVVAGETTADVVAVYTPDESALVTVEDGEYEFRLDAALDARRSSSSPPRTPTAARTIRRPTRAMRRPIPTRSSTSSQVPARLLSGFGCS